MTTPPPGSYARDALQRIQATFRAAANSENAGPMAKYMRNQFPFLGIKSPDQRRLMKEAMSGLPAPTEDDLRTVTAALWDLPEREFQYAACGLIDRHIKVAGPGFIEHLRHLIVTKSWWDTVDSLAGPTGYLVKKYPELVTTMDAWLEGDELWLTRVAILHQLRYKHETDEERLFRYCLERAGHKDFFIRKAIGWALRQYSWTNPDAVVAFVEANREALSPLSVREALLAVNGGRKGTGNRPTQRISNGAE